MLSLEALTAKAAAGLRTGSSSKSSGPSMWLRNPQAEAVEASGTAAWLWAEMSKEGVVVASP